jgi:hypothetical protein
VADLWGLAASDTERKAIRIAAENTPGVRAVNDRMTVGPLFINEEPVTVERVTPVSK